VAELLPTRASGAHHAVHPHRQRADPAGAEPLIAHGLEPPSPTATMPTLPSGRTLALSPQPYTPHAKGVLDEVACPGFEYRGNSKHVLEPRSEDGRT
jgi:hypothetical protein